MRAPRPRPRSGITLTEILISLMIMGVGLISLATLFPVGLERIRRAQRDVRSVQLVRSALADISVRNLLGLTTFQASYWYYYYPNATGQFRDPFIQDTIPNSTLPGTSIFRGYGTIGGNPAYLPGQGLPVAFDPLWWAQVNFLDNTVAPDKAMSNVDNARFGSGVGFVRADPDGQGGAPVYGLQRLTTIEFFTPDVSLRRSSLDHSAQVFATQDDPVLLTEGEVKGTPPARSSTGSTVLPDLSLGGLTNDWTYTWMFTGQRIAPQTPTYIGNVVVFHNREFGLNEDPKAGRMVPAGERVVEAIYGYSTVVTPWSAAGSAYGFGVQDRTVLLRWDASKFPDPDVRVGGWIADVTYERDAARSEGQPSDSPPMSSGRFSLQPYPGQRCYWYRVARVIPAVSENQSGTSAPIDPYYRRMIVTVETPVQAKTLIYGQNSTTSAPGEPVHVNAALVCPSVVYVFPMIFDAR